MHSFIDHNDAKRQSKQPRNLRVHLEIIKIDLRRHAEFANVLDTSRSKLQWIYVTTLSRWFG